MSEIYDRLNKAWKTTIRVLLKTGKNGTDEIGELKDYANFLEKFSLPPEQRTNIQVWNDKYPINAKYTEYDKLDMSKTFEPLNINEIKDIDSIVNALKERFVYAGNTLIGNNGLVENSTNVNDSFCVYNSKSIISSKYIAYASSIISSEYIFGVQDSGNGKFIVASTCVGDQGAARLFNSYLIGNSSDIYFSHNLEGSQEIMFSFFLRGKRFVIGNVELSKEKYFPLKEKLLEDIADAFKHKKMPTIYEIVSGKKNPNYLDKYPNPKGLKDRINIAFNRVAKVVLKEELGDIDEYKDYLTISIPYYDLSIEKDAITGVAILTAKDFWKVPKNAPMINKTNWKVVAEEIKNQNKKGNGLNYTNLKDSIKKHGKFSQIYAPNCTDYDYPWLMGSSTHIYRNILSGSVKTSAYSLWPRESDNVFGSGIVISSSHIINTYLSTKINRGFEVDFSKDSSDIYFCHNVMGCNECMFTFNRAGGRFEIGGGKLEESKYYKLKDKLLEEITMELEDKKTYKYNIWNIGNKG